MYRSWRVVGLLVLALSWPSAAAVAASRVALVIGNGAYQHATVLANPVSDATDVANMLRSLGFEVILGTDLDRRAMDDKVRDFARAGRSADVALFYYAGHGVQVGNSNFLLPTNAQLETEGDLEFETIRLDTVMRVMEVGRENRTSIALLDACRDNRLARNLARSMGTRSAAVGSGLAPVQSGVGTFISFATQPGNVALDGEGRNSPFTAAFLRHAPIEGRSLNGVMIEVRKDVIKATKGQQVPWDTSALTGEFFFRAAGAVPAPATSAVPKTASASAPAAKPAIAAPPPSPIARKGECIVLERNLPEPVSVAVGLRFCSASGTDRARVIEVREEAIVFEVNGQQEFACGRGQLCQFDWQSGAPAFTISFSSDNRPAQMVARRR